MPDLERRIDEISRRRVVELETRYRRVARRILLAVVITALTTLSTATATGVLIAENRDKSHEIQDQRARTIRENCEWLNDRHDAALREPSGQQVRAVIQALAPRRDCRAVVRAAVHSPAPGR